MLYTFPISTSSLAECKIPGWDFIDFSGREASVSAGNLTLQWPDCSGKCSVCSLQFALKSELCPMQSPVCSVKRSLCRFQFSVFSVQCDVWSVHLGVCSEQFAWCALQSALCYVSNVWNEMFHSLFNDSYHVFNIYDHQCSVIISFEIISEQ